MKDTYDRSSELLMAPFVYGHYFGDDECFRGLPTN